MSKNSQIACFIEMLLLDMPTSQTFAGLSISVHEITACHQSLSATNSCVTTRIRFLPVTMTGRFLTFNSISYTEARHEWRVIGTIGTMCRLPDIVSGTGEIFIPGAGTQKLVSTRG